MTHSGENNGSFDPSATKVLFQEPSYLVEAPDTVYDGMTKWIGMRAQAASGEVKDFLLWRNFRIDGDLSDEVSRRDAAAFVARIKIEMQADAAIGKPVDIHTSSPETGNVTVLDDSDLFGLYIDAEQRPMFNFATIMQGIRTEEELRTEQPEVFEEVFQGALKVLPWPEEDKRSAVEKRTDKLAKEAGDHAAKAANELLERHFDIVSRRVIKQIVAREFDRAASEFKDARELGRHNDNSSHAPGLTALLTAEGYRLLSALSNNDGNEYPYLTEYFESLEPLEGNLYRLRLANGTYRMGWGGCQFHGEVDVEDERETDHRNPFSTGYDSILRIEGDSGELWQNVNYYPDGTPRERQ